MKTGQWVILMIVAAGIAYWGAATMENQRQFDMWDRGYIQGLRAGYLEIDSSKIVGENVTFNCTDEDLNNMKFIIVRREPFINISGNGISFQGIDVRDARSTL